MKNYLIQLVLFLLCTCSSQAYYQAEQGRWLNRDPIGEWGGLNIFNFIENGSLNEADYLGKRRLWERTSDITTYHEVGIEVRIVKCKCEDGELNWVDEETYTRWEWTYKTVIGMLEYEQVNNFDEWMSALLDYLSGGLPVGSLIEPRTETIGEFVSDSTELNSEYKGPTTMWPDRECSQSSDEGQHNVFEKLDGNTRTRTETTQTGYIEFQI